MLCTLPCKCRVYFQVPGPLGTAPAVQDRVFVTTLYLFSKLVSKAYNKTIQTTACLDSRLYLQVTLFDLIGLKRK